MSTNLPQCRRAVTFLHQKPCGRHNAVSLSVLPIRDKSTLSHTRLRGQVKRRRLQETRPELFTSKPTYLPLNLEAEGEPSDLSCLRPPILEYVEQPKPGEGGKIPIGQRLKYWQRLATTHAKFYKDGVVRVWQNNKERRKILQRLGPTWGKPGKLHICAMLGREREPKDGRPPKITRKEYQLCLRTRSDIHRLVPFAIVLAVFGEWTPLVMPLAFIPEVCHRPSDRMKTAERWCKRRDYFHSKANKDIFLAADKNAGVDKEKSLKATLNRYLLWGYVADATFWIKLTPYIPRSWNAYLALNGLAFIPRHHEILADTVLIMREGGFGRLSAEDISEYCMKCASARFYLEARVALQNGVHPANEAMRKRMAPILEQHAKQMLDIDWTRLAPRFWWMQELTVRSGNAPDAWYKTSEDLPAR
ncbi:hypothetical protein A1O3_03002 [Capronia epimyces CBS 606.96]|uniref:Letm1 RBD domain-containing protein n=1 Tax=Capronia epimyces CBS 606.96 TaxID=1182542 RepID=W9YJU0_9EURO|nr:uncharacterized protein A1O3_03002 [Capronia epimyces CBS 606.96]EXJ89935.1 hypothetical protein A1O3_03002 [Capronia epimyces CBS 606.96]